MKKIIFVEGVSGVGKSTTVQRLGERLKAHGCSVECHFEGDPDSPLDLCWVAYLTPAEFGALQAQYPDFSEKMTANILYKGSYLLLRYQVGKTALYSPDLQQFLHQREFCYNPVNATVPLEKFTQVFTDLWKRYGESADSLDFEIFDGSLVSHMTSDLLRNYHASAEEIKNHLNTLLKTVEQFRPTVFYLSAQDVSHRLSRARESRGQSPATPEKAAFWEARKQLDLAVLPALSAPFQIIDISGEDWDIKIEQMTSTLLQLPE